MDFRVRLADHGCMDRRAALLFAALGVAWGIPYLLIKVSLDELSPAMLVFLRTSLAAAMLLPLAALRGQLRGTARRWRPILAYAVIEVIVPWLLIGHVEQRLPSSTTGLLIAATPLVGVGLGLLVGRHERLGGAGWFGLALGLVGVAALVGLDIDTSDRVAVLQLLVVVIGYAVGPMILSRSLSDEPGTAVVGLSFGAASVGALGVLLATGGWPSAVPSGGVIAAVAVLAVVCTAGSFLMFFALVGQIGPVRTTAVTYVNPAVAIIAGALFLDERITTWTLVGFVLVLAGSVLLTRRPAPVDPTVEDLPALGGAEVEAALAVAFDEREPVELAVASAAVHSPRSVGGGVVTRTRGRRRVGRAQLARRR